jgi:hypothetical protein
MQLHVFVTASDHGDGTGPIAFVAAVPGAVLPENPRGLEWRYFATVMDDDHLLAPDREHAMEAIGSRSYYISNRII